MRLHPKVCPRPRDQGPNTEDFRKERRSQGSLSDKLGVRCPREGAKRTVGVRVSETLKDAVDLDSSIGSHSQGSEHQERGDGKDRSVMV